MTFTAIITIIVRTMRKKYNRKWNFMLDDCFRYTHNHAAPLNSQCSDFFFCWALPSRHFHFFNISILATWQPPTSCCIYTIFIMHKLTHIPLIASLECHMNEMTWACDSSLLCVFSELKAWEKRSHWMRLKLKLLSWWCVTFAHSFLSIFRECYPHLHVYILSVSLSRALRCVDNWFFSLQILWRFWRLKIDHFVPYRKDLTHCTLSIVRLTKKGSLSGISISSITTHWKF